MLQLLFSNLQWADSHRGKRLSGITILCCLLFAGVAPARSQSAANEWIWMGGSSRLGSSGIVAGVYGTLGTPGAGNTPGSRASAATWTDKRGNLWLFSGEVFQEYYNDLWMFNPSTAEWTWMGGSNADVPGIVGGVAGVYGTLGHTFRRKHRRRQVGRGHLDRRKL